MGSTGPCTRGRGPTRPEIRAPALSFIAPFNAGGGVVRAVGPAKKDRLARDRVADVEDRGSLGRAVSRFFFRGGIRAADRGVEEVRGEPTSSGAGLAAAAAVT